MLFVDDSGDGILDLALRAKALGHDVLWFLRTFDPVKRPVGRGMIERVPEWLPHTRWADLIIFSANGRYMQDAKRLRDEGRLVIGGTPESAAWELKRVEGMTALRRAGIAVPAYQSLNNLDAALAVAARHDTGIALKPAGDVADKSLSFVAKTPAEAVWRLQRWKTQGKRFPHGLLLQDRIEGIEFAVGAWFGPGGFVDGWEENHEFKRFFPGDLGPNTGEFGTVMRLVRKSKLADMVLKPLEDQLSRIGYVGNVDVNCIVDKDGQPWPLEFTMRFGYPAINVELALHQSDPIEFLACVASGDTPPSRTMNTFSVGVICVLPPFPFPYGQTDETVGIPIEGVTAGIEDNLHFCDVQVDKGELQTAGAYVLVSTGTGETVVEARREALRVLKRIRIYCSPYYRNDIGSRLRSEFDELQRHGFAAGALYA